MINDNRNFHLHSIEKDHLRYVAKLHEKAFDDSALTKLGIEPIRRYYEWQLTGPHDCYAVGIFDCDNSLSGYCFSGVFHGSLSGFLTKNKKYLFLWILTHPWLVKNPLVTDRIRLALNIGNKKRVSIPPTSTNSRNSFGILSIAVDPEKQGMGIGQLIMDAVEKEALKKGFTQMHLTVHTTNIGAISFYERCGWIKSGQESGNWNGYMTKPLHSNSKESQ